MPNQTNYQIVKALIVDYRTIRWAETVMLQDQAQARSYTGRVAVEEVFRAFYVEGFADAQVDVRCIITDESAAAAEYVFRGRHTGSFVGIAPTGRAVVLPMAVICEICEGQVWRVGLYYDAGTLLRQLGLAP